MLTLSLYRGRRIWIGPDVYISLPPDEGRTKVRIGIHAPADVEIMREELLDDADPRSRANEDNPDGAPVG